MIEFTIPKPTPSLNQFYWGHWSKKMKNAKEWRKWVWAARVATGTKELMAMEAHRHVTVERYGSRKLDRDNFIGGCKGIIDALVKEGFILDDSPAHVSIEYHQYTGKPYRTIIKIEGESQWKESMKKQPSSSSQECSPSPAITNCG